MVSQGCFAAESSQCCFFLIANVFINITDGFMLNVSGCASKAAFGILKAVITLLINK